ncbi:MAG: EamA family transporter [Bacteroidota bacterium]
MIYLLLTILCTTAIFIIFKLFERFRIDPLQAIVVNYIIASCVGFSLDDSNTSFEAIPYQNWFLFALIAGMSFIFMFYVAAITTQKRGISIVSVASKTSLVIPVVFAFFLYGDSMPLIKIAGIVLALIAIYLTFMPASHSLPETSQLSSDSIRINQINGKGVNTNHSGWGLNGKLILFPIILFVGTGLLDTLFKYIGHRFLGENDINLFVTSLFLIAAFTGIIVIIVILITSKKQLQFKNIPGGIVLGIANYGSLYFFIRTLEIDNLESSIIFPINNMGIISLSAICAFLLFKERLTKTNWIGIALSIIAIAMISFA